MSGCSYKAPPMICILIVESVDNPAKENHQKTSGQCSGLLTVLPFPDLYYPVTTFIQSINSLSKSHTVVKRRQCHCKEKPGSFLSRVLRGAVYESIELLWTEIQLSNIVFLQKNIHCLPQQDGFSDALTFCQLSQTLKLILRIVTGFRHHLFFTGHGNPVPPAQLRTV